MKNKTNILIMIILLCLVSFGFTDVVFAGGTCPLGPAVTKDLYGALKVFRILAPILVITLSSIDAIKALTKGDGGADFKRVAQRFIKRVIIAVVLFFLPVLVDQLFQMTDVWGANGTCDLESAGVCSKYDNDPSKCAANGCQYIEDLGCSPLVQE